MKFPREMIVREWQGGQMIRSRCTVLAINELNAEIQITYPDGFTATMCVNPCMLEEIETKETK